MCEVLPIETFISINENPNYNICTKNFSMNSRLRLIFKRLIFLLNLMKIEIFGISFDICFR